MKDPFEQKGALMVAIAEVAVPVLPDKLGGTITVTEADLTSLGERLGGTPGVKAREVEPGIYRCELVTVQPRPAGPVM
jgi:hypothetical protein